ncbi:MAG: cation:proton antiporter [Pseudolysinimonas sp.]|uniref:cation:proton antiporter domain-containing protein n=1 Tax=Pseudolysinimonas sp. TaxID=2680009 RepID=UPI0032663C3F
MQDANFTLIVLICAAVVLGAVFSNRLTRLLRVPAPALFLILASVAALFLPAFEDTARLIDERVVSIALVVILFDGGMRIGWKRIRGSLGAITLIGIAGTAVTAAAIAAAAHFLLGFDWTSSLLLGAALSPTDPAVVFSVLGQREILGRSGTILEGESGANDPVGIALMVTLIGVTGTGWQAIGNGLGAFTLQLAIGAIVGIGGGLALTWVLRHGHLADEALTVIFPIVAAVLLYALAAAFGGSGFLAAFIAGILVGDVRAPYKRDIVRFNSGMASLAEIAVFILLGLSVRLADVFQPDVLIAGFAIAALLIFVIRPVLVGLLIAPVRLRRGERAFVLWAGLKGAVPILLGMLILGSGVADADRLYAIIFIVVVISVLLQGGLVPLFARLFRVPTHAIPVRPWSLDIRFADEPDGLHRHVVAAGSPADGRTVADVAHGNVDWISLISRSGRNIPVRNATTLEAGDVVLTQADGDASLEDQFTSPTPE